MEGRRVLRIAFWQRTGHNAHTVLQYGTTPDSSTSTSRLLDLGAGAPSIQGMDFPHSAEANSEECTV